LRSSASIAAISASSDFAIFLPFGQADRALNNPGITAT
jgi:hypothetical protein